MLARRLANPIGIGQDQGVQPLPEYTMAYPTTTDLLQHAADHLPSGASVKEAVERRLFRTTLKRGMSDREADRLVEHDEVRRRLAL